MKCPECNRELIEDSQTLDENNILREQYECLIGHVWEKLEWFPVPISLEPYFTEEREE